MLLINYYLKNATRIVLILILVQLKMIKKKHALKIAKKKHTKHSIFLQEFNTTSH